MAKLLALVALHFAALLVAVRVAQSAPAANTTTELEQLMAEVFQNTDYDNEDVFIPLSDKQRFDAFDWKLCHSLSARNPGNVVVSPVSIKLVLAMLYEGAAGNTARELEVALEMATTRLESRMKFSNILKSLLTKQPEFVLDVGTRVYVQQNTSVQPRFSKILQAFYNSDIEKLNFKEPSAAVRAMNLWVDKLTHGRIKTMFQEDAISPDVMMVLLNTIYFKGLWRYPFNENDTIVDSFSVSPTATVPAQFMKMDRYLYYSESVELDSKILRLPYMGKKYSMFIVLPNKVDGLERMMKAVTPAMLRNQMFHMDNMEVSLKLPKFSFEFTTELEDVLKELGIREIFGEADLPGIVQGPNRLSVSKVFQKAGLDVNEKGTTAYAATGLVIVDRVGGAEVEFHATHPFLFYIMDETTGTVIFVGKVVSPKKDIPLRDSLQPRVNDDVVKPGLLGAPQQEEMPALVSANGPVRPVQLPVSDDASAGDVASYNDVIDYLANNNSTVLLKVWTYLNSVLRKPQESKV